MEKAATAAQRAHRLAMTPPKRPEAEARERIDADLVAAGWKVQDREDINLAAGRGVAIREFKMEKGFGFADYLLFVDGKAVGALEAKKAGIPLIGIEEQAKKYSEGLPEILDAPIRPLPFLYLSTGVETRFTNGLDPEPRSRSLFNVYRPETLAERLASDPLDKWVSGWGGNPTVQDGAPALGKYAQPSSLRARIRAMPPLFGVGLWPNQRRGVESLEESLKADRPRALIQMATGSGKTILAVTAAYRLIKFGGARRVLFLVDRTNLGQQAEKEFQNYRTPDDKRKFTELYNAQRLAGNTIGASAKVVITTIQRLYSMLRGDADLDPALEEESRFEVESPFAEPVHVAYNPALPPEYFDFIFVDECHRSIYSIWREVLDYFDAYLIGLTATPAKHTFGYFNQNLVMEYAHQQAVADEVNVDFEVYRIRTEITEKGSTIDAKPGVMVGYRDRRTRQQRWEQADEDITYAAADLDRAVLAKDQIRLIVRTFRDRLFTEIFPGRKEVPKTLIFAKDDSHAEDVVEIIREEFGKGNNFCSKITYKATGKKEDLIQSFRTGYNPRIAVTVDMIATGTDIKPIEIVMFMRSVKSRVLFEQMKGRGVRTISKDDLQAVTPDAIAKTHFMIVDCVGLTETEMADTQPLERKRTVAFKTLLEHVALGGNDPDVYSSLASRLSRLDRECDDEDRKLLQKESGGVSLQNLAQALVNASNPDLHVAKAREEFALPPETMPSEDQIAKVEINLLKDAAKPLATNPGLRTLIQEVKAKLEQMIDEISVDRLLEAGASPEATEKARTLVQDFEKYIADHKDEIDALQFFYSQPRSRRLRFKDIKALAEAIQAPPRSWTSEKLWRAYQQLDKSKVRGASAQRMLTDLVSLVRRALHQDEELVPYKDKIATRFANWIARQENSGRRFTAEQIRWLEMMRDHVANSLEITVDDFGFAPFVQEGGIGKASQVFGKELPGLLKELNEELAA